MVSAAFKRMSNILEQAREKGIAAAAEVDEALLLEPEEAAEEEDDAVESADELDDDEAIDGDIAVESDREEET